MPETGDVLRRYCEDRLSLGEPEIFLRAGRRQAWLDAVAGSQRVVAAPTAGSEDVGEIADIDELAKVAAACHRCALAKTRQSVVFADGSPSANVLCVGEAPGANEDRIGKPFVGRAGKLLDRLLLAVGFRRSDVYICNVLKCRPPENRNPLPEEIELCSPFLLRQLDLVAPQVIVAFGTFAARTLLERRESLGRLRLQTHLYRGVPLVATYHPAALLRNPGWVRPTWEDLQRARAIGDSGKAGVSDG